MRRGPGRIGRGRGATQGAGEVGQLRPHRGGVGNLDGPRELRFEQAEPRPHGAALALQLPGLRALLGLVGVVPDWAAVIEYRDMLVAVRERVAALKEAGKTLEQAVAAKPTAAFDDKWEKFVITPDAFTELVYMGV